MPPLTQSTGLTITNPLVLYRALLATKKLHPDPAQHRLARHLQKLYQRLKDYEPAVDYKYELDRINDAVGEPCAVPEKQHKQSAENDRRTSLFSRLREQKAHADTLALTRKLTSHESAVRLQSPQGLLLYGEVGTGKSMLIDLLADCLPNGKKRRWHFNAFMLHIFAKLEQRRQYSLTVSTCQNQEHALLWLARDMISTSPILFLDEFQLPDRSASKILSSLFTCFFHLGGVLVATSNRMPEELANASGVELAAPPAWRLGMLRNPWGLLDSGNNVGNSENMFAGKRDFAAFLEVLRARCEIWDMEGSKDWRRQETEEIDPNLSAVKADLSVESRFQDLQHMSSEKLSLGYKQSINNVPPHQQSPVKEGQGRLPKYYFVHSTDPTTIGRGFENTAWTRAVLRVVLTVFAGTPEYQEATEIPWQKKALRVYGRNLYVPRYVSGVTSWEFEELCTTNLGPADYITLASTFHTFILDGVPVLTSLHKNEARRFITLLDALYEARCKLLVRGSAGPDYIFFPEHQQSAFVAKQGCVEGIESTDGVYAETFAEIYQDQTSPFRPNISSYTSSASEPSYGSSPLPSTSSLDSTSARSVLADEDSDFGPTYGAGRSPSSCYRGPDGCIPGAGNETGHQSSPDFARIGAFIGEDEKFAYKRAQSRLWELCGARWWAREDEKWWQPLDKELRGWESSVGNAVASPVEVDVKEEKRNVKGETLFRHGASPFRTSQDPPPKIPWTHAWGMMKWGKRAGAWGQGPDGLTARLKRKTDYRG
ncbi:MAG: hypothetical protein Q9209_006672 [Squamulea sp. 1 TL-2023]